MPHNAGYTRDRLFRRGSSTVKPTLWLGSRSSLSVPEDALLTEDGNPILTELGEYILTES